MPASRSVVSVLLRKLGDFLYTLKADPAARQPHGGHRGAGLTRWAGWEPWPPGGATVALAALVRRRASA